MLIGVAGDWHGNVRWLQTAIPRLKRAGAEELWHLGDLQLGFGLQPEKYAKALNYWLDKTALDLYLVEGNHEGFPWFDTFEHALLEPWNSAPVRSNGRIHVVPRGYIFERPGATGPFYGLAVGGAASINVKELVPGVTWHPQEAITPAQEEELLTRLASLRRTGVAPQAFFSHEAPFGVEELEPLRNSGGWSPAASAYADAVRGRLDSIFREAAPALAMHGHWHHFYRRAISFSTASGSFTTEVIGTTEEYTEHNLWLLDTETLEVKAVPRFKN